MLLDLSERGRYLGLVLFSAQQFRSQVQRRVVGQRRHRASTAAWTPTSWRRRATPRSRPATKIKLATLPKGELMVRHPHFTQPIFVQVPPAGGARRARGRRALSARGRAVPFRRRGRAPAPALDRGITAEAVRAADRRPPARRTSAERWRRPAGSGPADALAYFTACLGRRIDGEVGAASRRGIRRASGEGDGYGYERLTKSSISR